MTVDVLAAAVGIIAAVVSTTMIVVGKLTRVEVMLAELRASMANFEHRITQLEKDAVDWTSAVAAVIAGVGLILARDAGPKDG